MLNKVYVCIYVSDYTVSEEDSKLLCSITDY